MDENPLGTDKISKLLRNFAIPSIMATLVSSLYNIVDQVFIGHGVGYLGSASRFSVCLGGGRKEKAARELKRLCGAVLIEQ